MATPLFFRNSTLILLAFSTAFYARLFCSLAHAPGALNFFHFATIPVAFGVAIVTTRTQDRLQIRASQALLTGLLILLTVMFASAFLNRAGIINVIFHFLLLGEPFMVFAVLMCLPVSWQLTERIRSWLTFACLFNLISALVQYPLIGAGLLYANGFDATDGMGGVFFVSGAGNYLSATVSIYFSLYFWTRKTVSIWWRSIVIAAAVLQMQLSDSKQIVLVFAIAGILLMISNAKNIQKTLTYLITMIVAGIIFYWCMNNLEAFAGFLNYANKQDAYGPDGLAIQIKTAPLRIIPTYYTSALNWLLGLGSGHTVGRLGGWLIKDYGFLFAPLGGTSHEVSEVIWSEMWGNWLAVESTVFSPFYGWAGIWGDLGLLGLATYIGLGVVVWRHICFDDLSRFLLLTVAGFGLIFTQMEEPGYMIFTSMLLGLRWHEHRQVTTAPELYSEERPTPEWIGPSNSY